jgi:hypothetical protein
MRPYCGLADAAPRTYPQPLIWTHEQRHDETVTVNDERAEHVTPMSAAERQAAADVLTTEYGMLMSALSSAWTASLTRTSLFLGVLSAAGVGFGLAAQGGVDLSSVPALALVVLVLILFLGVATFVRLVQVQRESLVYIVGMNRIRGFFQETAPASRPYFVLPAHDDTAALYRSVGTGMLLRQPRFELLHLTVQTQGIVGIVTAAVAAACAGLAAAGAGATVMWIAASAGFVVTVVTLFLYWGRSIADIRRAITPLRPTPSDELDAPI